MTLAICSGGTHFEWSASGCERAVRRRVDHARQDRVGAHAVAAVLGVEGLDEREHRRLGGDVAGGAGERPQRGPRRDAHERAAARRAPAAASPRARAGRPAAGSAASWRSNSSALGLVHLARPSAKPPTRFTTAPEVVDAAPPRPSAACSSSRSASTSVSRSWCRGPSSALALRLHDPGGGDADSRRLQQLLEHGGAERAGATGDQYGGGVQLCHAREPSTCEACAVRIPVYRRISRWSSRLSPPAKLFVRDLVDGQPIDSLFVVRERARRQKRNGEAFLKLQLGDVTGSVEAVCWDGVDELPSAAAPGAVVRVVGRFSVDQRYGAALTVRALRAAEPGEYDPPTCTDGPAGPVDADGRRPARAGRHRPAARTCASCSTRSSPTTRESGRRWRDAPAAKYYHQAYRHGLLEHCLSVAQGVSAHLGHLPGHRPRRRGHRRAAARHRQDRGLREAGRRHRPDATPASSRARSRSATTGSAARSRSIAGLPAPSTRAGAAPHHPQPPRPARARQPGGPLHARGHARAHDRQPRRQARQLRPDREEPRRRRALVGLRPRPGGSAYFAPRESR